MSKSAATPQTPIYPPNLTLNTLNPFKSQYPQSHPTIFNRMKTFYFNVPKGPAPAENYNELSLVGKYRYKYLGRNASVWPVLHLGIGVMVLYYYVDRKYKGFIAPSKEFH